MTSILNCFCTAIITGSEWHRKPCTVTLQMTALQNWASKISHNPLKTFMCKTRSEKCRQPEGLVSILTILTAQCFSDMDFQSTVKQFMAHVRAAAGTRRLVKACVNHFSIWEWYKYPCWSPFCNTSGTIVNWRWFVWSSAWQLSKTSLYQAETV